MKNFVLAKNLKNRFCDITFYFPAECCHGKTIFKQIRAHKIILSVSSDYFKNFFHFQSNNAIMIKGYSYEIFKMMIDYFYDNNLKIDYNDSNFLLESLKLSDEYMLTDYKILILDKIIDEIKIQEERLSLNNYLNYLILLIKKSNELLLTECINLVTRHLEAKIRKTNNSESIILKLIMPNINIDNKNSEDEIDLSILNL
jgi:hypothetical protein